VRQKCSGGCIINTDKSNQLFASSTALMVSPSSIPFTPADSRSRRESGYERNPAVGALHSRGPGKKGRPDKGKRGNIGRCNRTRKRGKSFVSSSWLLGNCLEIVKGMRARSIFHPSIRWARWVRTGTEAPNLCRTRQRGPKSLFEYCSRGPRRRRKVSGS